MLLTTVLALATCFSAEDPKPVQLPADWAVGTRYRIELTTSREDLVDGKMTLSGSAKTPFDVEILAKRDDGYDVRWTFGTPEVTSNKGVDNPIAKRVSALTAGLQMDFKTDATGSFEKLLDPQKMEALAKKAVETLLADLEKMKDATPAVKDGIRRMMPALEGPAFHASCAKEAIMFYMPSGSSLVLGEKRSYEDQLANPFGGDPLPSRAYLELREVRKEQGEAVVVWGQTVDPERGGPLLEASIRALLKKSGRELPGEMAFSFDAIEDAATYVYDLKTGIPRSLVVTRATNMAGQRRLETRRFVVTMR